MRLSFLTKETEDCGRTRPIRLPQSAYNGDKRGANETGFRPDLQRVRAFARHRLALSCDILSPPHRFAPIRTIAPPHRVRHRQHRSISACPSGSTPTSCRSRRTPGISRSCLRSISSRLKNDLGWPFMRLQRPSEFYRQRSKRFQDSFHPARPCKSEQLPTQKLRARPSVGRRQPSLSSK